MELGATLTAIGTRFAVRAPQAAAVALCLFDGDDETRQLMTREGDIWTIEVAGVGAGAAYGFRAFGDWAPEHGLWFDAAKLLVDPYAKELDRPFTYDPRLSEYGWDSAAIIPRAIVQPERAPLPARPPVFQRGGLIYEAHMRGLTMLHAQVPEGQRGTVAALAHPAIIAHLQSLHVTAIELMPIVAWIDERHLPPLGLSNYWGYNPVAFGALDPRLCPGGVEELRATVAALHDAGIGVILDLVFNHTGESDMHGPVLSLRGLDNAAYAHAAPIHGGAASLINDTGCGNTLDFGQPSVRALKLATMRHFVEACGVDGFRFDLAPVLARSPGFSKDALLFPEIAADPVLSDRVMIAEPWDIGPGGYQLGQFPESWLEWNDVFRDDVRRFWLRRGPIAPLATRMAGSADIFGKPTRSVNFLAAHDGFTLADCCAYEARHNEANGEDNRDGHGENHSNNHGVEGPTDETAILAARDETLRAMLATLFVSTGTIMLTAGDEMGRSQQGNNNAYAQDNPLGWVDWAALDAELLAYVQELAAQRAAHAHDWMTFPEPGVWSRPDGTPMSVADWENPATGGLEYRSHDGQFGFRLSRLLRQFTVLNPA